MATVAKRLQVCRMIFKAAMRAKYISVNPFPRRLGTRNGQGGEVFLRHPRNDTTALGRLPGRDLAAVCGLGAYGGFRVPSEACSLRWQDVLWDQNKIVVQSPKGERYGKGERIIPMFPELRPILEEAFDQAQVGDVYCVETFRRFAVGKTGWMNCSLGGRFAKIIKRAGLTRWPRLFHALRASRERNLRRSIRSTWLQPGWATRHGLR